MRIKLLENYLNLFIKNLCLLNFSFHRNVYQNRFINECACARKKKAKIAKSQSFFVRYRRTYFLIYFKGFY